MTLQETNEILSIIFNFYPSFTKDRNPETTSAVWYSIFRNVPFEEVRRALLVFIARDTKGFPPVPGMLRKILLSAEESTQMTEMEAWSRFRKAISRSLYYGREEFEKLPPVLQSVAGSAENLGNWARMDEWEVENRIFPWFCRAYQDRLERENQCRLLPDSGFPLLS